jgi:hypothetical protein
MKGATPGGRLSTMLALMLTLLLGDWSPVGIILVRKPIMKVYHFTSSCLTYALMYVVDIPGTVEENECIAIEDVTERCFDKEVIDELLINVINNILMGRRNTSP